MSAFEHNWRTTFDEFVTSRKLNLAIWRREAVAAVPQEPEPPLRVPEQEPRQEQEVAAVVPPEQGPRPVEEAAVAVLLGLALPALGPEEAEEAPQVSWPVLRESAGAQGLIRLRLNEIPPGDSFPGLLLSRCWRLGAYRPYPQLEGAKRRLHFARECLSPYRRAFEIVQG